MNFIKTNFIFLYNRLFRQDDRLLMIGAGVVTGICSGLAAVALRLSLEWIIESLHPLRHHMWAIALPGAGAVLSSLYLNKVVKEAPGHGVPEVIYAVSRYGGLLRFRSSFSRLISSFLTIGSGGSAGPEAPVVMSGSTIGSNIAKALGLNDRQRVTLVGCGTSGAIAAIFNAPIAGLIFATEVVLGDWKFVNIIPIAIAAVAGAELSQAIIPEQVLFNHEPFRLGIIDTTACVGLALGTAFVSVIFTKIMRQSGRLAKGTSVPIWCRAAIGGSVVGLISMKFPVVLGEGYSYIQSMISETFTMGLLLTGIAVIAKIIATSATLGWGGSGGIFAPCLLIGSLTGTMFHQLIVYLFPKIGFAGSGAYALLGMTGLISGVMQAPLTGIFLIVEITGGYETILPLILVSSLSSTVTHYIEPASFYFKDLIDRGQFLRPGTDARILTDLDLEELLETNVHTAHENMLLREFIELIKTCEQNYFPILEEGTNRFKGIIKISAIRPYVLDIGMYDMVFINQIMDTSILVASMTDDLQEVLTLMDEDAMDTIPVVEEELFIGMISKTKILDLYRRELMMQTSPH